MPNVVSHPTGQGLHRDQGDAHSCSQRNRGLLCAGVIPRSQSPRSHRNRLLTGDRKTGSCPCRGIAWRSLLEENGSGIPSSNVNHRRSRVGFFSFQNPGRGGRCGHHAVHPDTDTVQGIQDALHNAIHCHIHVCWQGHGAACLTTRVRDTAPPVQDKAVRREIDRHIGRGKFFRCGPLQNLPVVPLGHDGFTAAGNPAVVPDLDRLADITAACAPGRQAQEALVVFDDTSHPQPVPAPDQRIRDRGQRRGAARLNPDAVGLGTNGIDRSIRVHMHQQRLHPVIPNDNPREDVHRIQLAHRPGSRSAG